MENSFTEHLITRLYSFAFVKPALFTVFTALFWRKLLRLLIFVQSRGKQVYKNGKFKTPVKNNCTVQVLNLSMQHMNCLLTTKNKHLQINYDYECYNKRFL